jgi:hypothetical protein
VPVAETVIGVDPSGAGIPAGILAGNCAFALSSSTIK